MSLSKAPRIILYLLFALSGFCALVYEILWTRYLSLTFGTGIVAVSLVTATFMCGLALGSHFVGRYCEKSRNLLSLYAILEAGIALSALAFPPLLILVRSLYVFGARTLPDLPGLTWPLYLFCASIILLVPAFCMGGTLPVMCRLFGNNRAGGRVGILYGLNTFGATLGTLACGFILIPNLGMSLTSWLAVGINLIIAVVAVLLGRMSQFSAQEEPVAAALLPVPVKENQLLLLSIGLIGFFSLGYEILWTRVFLLLLGNTTYAFSMMLGAYLVGIALGGSLYGFLVKPETDNRRLFTRLVTGASLTILLTAPFYDRLTYLFQSAYELSNETWSLYVLMNFGIVLLVMIAPTILSGAALPAVVNLLSPDGDHLGQNVGRAVFCNTLGAVVGSLLAGLVLIPSLGVLNSFQFVGVVNLLLALFLWLNNRKGKVFDRLVPVTLLIGLVAAFLPLEWNGKLMTSGVYYYARIYAMNGGLNVLDDGVKLVDMWEGIDTTVSVHDAPEGQARFFRVNGKTDGGSNKQGMVTELLVGHLPLLMHKNPQDVMVVGLGSGITLRGLADHPVDSIDCVEISPGVVAAERYFRDSNRNALANPKVKLTVADARNRLLVSEKLYDVIVSVPSNQWQSGNANLFTDEYYRLAQSRLKAGGVFCQWFGFYDMTTMHLRSAIKTLLKTFPHLTAFLVGTDLIVVGSEQLQTFDYQILRERMQIDSVAEALHDAEVDTVGDLFGNYFLFADEPLKTFSAGGELVTDDKSSLEFGSRFIFGMDAYLNNDKRNKQALLEAEGGIFLPITSLGENPEQVRRALNDLIDGFRNAGRKAESDFLVQYLRQI